MNLNDRAYALVRTLLAPGQAEQRRVAVLQLPHGGQVLDFGIKARGGLLAGLDLAQICLASLAEVTILPGDVDGRPCSMVQVVTDHPLLACLASQYAGWQISEGSFFAMGSGPMRAAYGHEAIFTDLDYREDTSGVVGVLEGRTVPPREVVEMIADCCRVDPAVVTLLIAPTASLAGGVQVVARSAETALHKLHELKFDLKRVVSASGVAPLPPVAGDDLAAIGRTNDAILYGAQVILHVTGDDDSLAEIGPKVPSSGSRDYGEPFSAIFARYNHDFYAVDPGLFSPAQIVFHNVQTGRTHTFGQPAPNILTRSFYSN